jgi:hypothetical protein
MLEELLIHGSVHAYSRVQARPTTSRTPYLVKADMLCLRYMDTLRMSVCLSIPSQLQQRNRDHLIDSAVPHSRLRAPSLPQCDLQSPSVVDPGGGSVAQREFQDSVAKMKHQIIILQAPLSSCPVQNRC